MKSFLDARCGMYLSLHHTSRTDEAEEMHVRPAPSESVVSLYLRDFDDFEV